MFVLYMLIAKQSGLSVQPHQIGASNCGCVQLLIRTSDIRGMYSPEFLYACDCITTGVIDLALFAVRDGQ